MVFIKIMTRGAAEFFRFFWKNPKTQVLQKLQQPPQAERHKETPCGDLGGSARGSIKL